jgi:lysophospholipase L1-like esterase
MAIIGYRIRKDGGTPVDVGLTHNYQWLDVAEGANVLFELQSYDSEGQSSDWISLNKTIPTADDPLLVGHGDSMMWGSGDENTDPATENPSIQTKNLLTGTWQHANVGYPGARMAHASGASPDDLIAGGVAVVDPLYDAEALYNVLITNGGINDVSFVPGPIALATNYPWILQRLKTLYIEYGLARRAVGWGNGLGPIVSPMPVCDFPNTPSDYETYLRGPFNDWLAANFWQFAAEYADWTGNANIGDGANTNNATYFDILDPDSGGTADRLHLTAAGYAIEATYFRDAINRTTSMTLPPDSPAGFNVTASNCEQISVGYIALEGIETIHHYEIRVNGGALSDEVIDIGRTNPYVIKNLEGATAYAIEIRTVDVGGFHSSWSWPKSVTTPAGVFTRLYAIDCGRTSGGTVGGLLQDTLFTNGAAYSPGAYTPRTFLVDGPAPAAGYHTLRISDSILPITYTFTGRNASFHHRVRMHFVMPTTTHSAAPVANQWKMDVVVNGVTVKNDMDLAMEIGVGEVVYIVETEVAAGPTTVTVEITQVNPGTAGVAVVELFGVV